MKMYYFEQDEPDDNDWQLKMCIGQGYVPTTCLLGGSVVWYEIQRSHDPCAGCNGPRNKCKGRMHKEAMK